MIRSSRNMPSFDEHGHPHRRLAPPSPALGRSVLIVSGFGLVEIIVGWLSGSLALASDGVHMLTDALALALAWGAQWVARREAGPALSFGYARIEPLAAFVNGLFYLAVLVFIVYEAIDRLRAPPPIEAAFALPVAILGLVVNALVWRMLHHERDELNTRAALLHVIGDFAGSLVAIVAISTVWLTGWTLIDPLLTLLISALLLLSTARLLRASVTVLMNAVPSGLRPDDVMHAVLAVPGVMAVHDLHLWTLDEGRPAMAAHVSVDDMASWPVVLAALQDAMRTRFSIQHLTLQPEAPAAADKLQAACTERDLQRDMALRFERELETQRRELAQALERDLAEHLTGIRSMAATLQSRLSAREPSLAQLAALVLGNAESMSAQIRTLIARLRPEALQATSLPESLRALIADWRLRRPQLRIELLLAPADDADFGLGAPENEALALRLVRAALEGALEHAGATMVVVSVLRAADELRLQISDDGRPLQARADWQAQVLDPLAERVRAGGGQLSFERDDSGGTELRACLSWT